MFAAMAMLRGCAGGLLHHPVPVDKAGRVPGQSAPFCPGGRQQRTLEPKRLAREAHGLPPGEVRATLTMIHWQAKYFISSKFHGFSEKKVWLEREASNVQTRAVRRRHCWCNFFVRLCIVLRITCEVHFSKLSMHGLWKPRFGGKQRFAQIWTQKLIIEGELFIKLSRFLQNLRGDGAKGVHGLSYEFGFRNYLPCRTTSRWNTMSSVHWMLFFVAEIPGNVLFRRIKETLFRCRPTWSRYVCGRTCDRTGARFVQVVLGLH